jgi:hypothetical protein
MLAFDLGAAHGRLTQTFAADVSSSGAGPVQPMTLPIARVHGAHIWLQLALSLRALRL